MLPAPQFLYGNFPENIIYYRQAIGKGKITEKGCKRVNNKYKKRLKKILTGVIAVLVAGLMIIGPLMMFFAK